jgi:hypothetical protein
MTIGFLKQDQEVKGSQPGVWEKSSQTFKFFIETVQKQPGCIFQNGTNNQDTSIKEGMGRLENFSDSRQGVVLQPRGLDRVLTTHHKKPARYEM